MRGRRRGRLGSLVPRKEVQDPSERSGEQNDEGVHPQGARCARRARCLPGRCHARCTRRHYASRRNARRRRCCRRKCAHRRRRACLLLPLLPWESLIRLLSRTSLLGSQVKEVVSKMMKVPTVDNSDAIVAPAAARRARRRR